MLLAEVLGWFGGAPSTPAPEATASLRFPIPIHEADAQGKLDASTSLVLVLSNHSFYLKGNLAIATLFCLALLLVL